MSERAIRVSAEDVELKLTLSAKLLKKPFADAVLAPFTKAFNKRKGTEWKVDDLVSVAVDSVYMTDFSVPATVVLLVDTVHAVLTYRSLPRREMLLDDDPFSGKQWEPPPPSGNSAGTVDFIADEDDRSEIEKLKAERRAKRLEKEAAKAAEKEQSTHAQPSVAAPADEPRREAAPVANPTSASTSTGTQLAEAIADASDDVADPLALLDDAERSVAAVRAQVDGIAVEVRGDAQAGKAGDEHARRLTVALREINRLMVALDEITLGALSGGEQATLRARKKAASALLEEELMPTVKTLQHVVAGSKAMPAAPPVELGAKPSAEIDSDED